MSRNGKFFKVDIVSKDGYDLPPYAIKKQLEKVLVMAGGEQALQRFPWFELENSFVNGFVH